MSFGYLTANYPLISSIGHNMNPYIGNVVNISQMGLKASQRY